MLGLGKAPGDVLLNCTDSEGDSITIGRQAVLKNLAINAPLLGGFYAVRLNSGTYVRIEDVEINSTRAVKTAALVGGLPAMGGVVAIRLKCPEDASLIGGTYPWIFIDSTPVGTGSTGSTLLANSSIPNGWAVQESRTMLYGNTIKGVLGWRGTKPQECVENARESMLSSRKHSESALMKLQGPFVMLSNDIMGRNTKCGGCMQLGEGQYYIMYNTIHDCRASVAAGIAAIGPAPAEYLSMGNLYRNSVAPPNSTLFSCVLGEGSTGKLWFAGGDKFDGNSGFLVSGCKVVP